MATLCTHVLDTAQGKPGAGMSIELYEVGANGKTLLKSVVTNREGRSEAPLLQGEEMRAGRYELVFAAGDYFEAQGLAMSNPRFIDRVTLAFGIAHPDQNYHVPLLVSPWTYTTYRGSA